MTLTDIEFQAIKKTLLGLCGIALGNDKQYLVRMRLEPLLNRYGIASYAELIRRIGEASSLSMKDEFVDAMTTKETSFLRDGHPFDAMRQWILPDMVQRHLQKRRQSGLPHARLRLWSAASSTGQEVYSLAIAIADYVQQLNLDRQRGREHLSVGVDHFWLMASDVSRQALEIARTGIYQANEVDRGLNEMHKKLYFDFDGKAWRIKDHLRKLIEFRIVNLARTFLDLGGFDLILCRNVLIYFDEPTRIQVCRQLADNLNPGGLLMLGATESLPLPISQLRQEFFGPSVVYRKPFGKL